MPIIGINFTSIEASFTEKKIDGPIDINSNPVIEDIRKKEINYAGINEVLALDFKFVTNYSPKIGEIVIKGEVLYQADDMKKVLSMWKDKKLDSTIGVDVLNHIFRRCLTKAITLADELRLPPPLTFPVVEGKPEKKEDK